MSDQSQILFEKATTIAGWNPGLVTESNIRNRTSGLTPFQKQLAYTAFSDQLSVDAMYFSGEIPFIHFKQLSRYDPNEVHRFHRKIWNEGRTPLLAIITPQEIRLYDCFDSPENDLESLVNLERGRFQNTEHDLKKLGEILHQSKIDSGMIWKEPFGKSIKIKNRVDRKLLNNLANARNLLSKNFHIPLEIIHDLLGRSLFTLYLEDRGILTAESYPSRPTGVNNFFDLLKHSEAVYPLFRFLKQKFNGDLFPVTVEEEEIIKKNPECLNVIQNCFSGNMDLVTRQLSIDWRMFQFQYIPIELISAIYEEFIKKEDETHQKIKKDGAVYTPLMLVEFILNEVLPWPDEKNQQYNLKILDPACGSGIFLVESYKRLIARWKYANRNQTINRDVLEQLLLNNIYGIEKDKEAIKVAAFSLYLTFLNYLEPKQVLTRTQFEPLIRWDKEQRLDDHENTKPGSNLFQFSTFNQELEILNKEFDLIVGNPPWKLGKLDADVAQYLTENALPQQIICAYLHYLPKFISNGVIALISTAKILFNTGQGYENFRRRFFTENNIDAIINLAVVRDIIFKNAATPGAVILFRKRNSETDTDRKTSVTYCVPRNIEIIKHKQSIVIDASEIKFLPLREILKENSRIFKIAMWGNVRDLKLIEKLKNTKSIKEYINNNEWGVGLIKDVQSHAGNAHLKNYPLLPTEKINQYFTETSGFPLLGNRHLTFRTNKKDVFHAPIILVKEGTKDAEFCCSYISDNITFLSSALGISVKNKDGGFHKALVACLNSTIATYFFFLTSSLWGVDRGGQILKIETMSFPALPYVMNEATITKLAQKVDEIIALKNSSQIILNEKQRIQNIRHEIDEILYQELDLSPDELALIRHVLDYSIVLNNRYRASNAENFANLDDDIVPYSKTLVKTISSTLKYIDRPVWVEILSDNNDRDAVRMIALHFNGVCPENGYIISRPNNLSQLLTDINTYTYEQHSESVYYRKVVKYYTKNVIYLVKPNQKRFWSIAQALNDADDLLIELINE